MTRKPMPDIISNLLQNKPDSKPVDQRTSTPVSHQAGIPVKQPTSKPAKKRTAPPPEQSEPIKATFYLSRQTVDALEDAWLSLRKMAKARGDISKSGIVQEAIQLAVEDLKDKREKSRLADRMGAGR